MYMSTIMTFCEHTENRTYWLHLGPHPPNLGALQSNDLRGSYKFSGGEFPDHLYIVNLPMFPELIKQYQMLECKQHCLNKILLWSTFAPS